jgi:hypothetical protein
MVGCGREGSVAAFIKGFVDGLRLLFEFAVFVGFLAFVFLVDIRFGMAVIIGSILIVAGAVLWHTR